MQQVLATGVQGGPSEVGRKVTTNPPARPISKITDLSPAGIPKRVNPGAADVAITTVLAAAL